ncbi:CubicO group peptidase (beta-lactamase class C family) [Chitinophaga skermanii]|uniref:CubicO group peptidase (Beta-lactamase class C family) n=1 Tax=Chitinophaga skermanii TaxID=331697 RepID=A0A327QL42_9BACT|nr:serine hydrolase [Chitinophaga skermanii]RAJ05386.1 CubicO group peptidase (beta-lactamase class C family) [Chitinophaga skermanii]
MKKLLSVLAFAGLCQFAQAQSLPRSTPAAEKVSEKGIEDYVAAFKQKGEDIHSFMVLRHGKVVAEQYFGDNSATKPHVMWSVSKTFTATAIGFAVQEKLLTVNDKVIKYFPNDLPPEVSKNLQQLEIRHLLTMTNGQPTEPRPADFPNQSWEKTFFALSIVNEPGTKFYYNSYATYMLSSILQKVTGKTVLEYLTPRLFQPLGIEGAVWDSNPAGVSYGGWGLHIKTEDMAKMGQFILQKGTWNGKQLLAAKWFDEATRAHIVQSPQWVQPNADITVSDWSQGYGYQMWRCRHNAFRADGKDGQFIIIIPEKDAVIVTTANVQNMQEEINLIWDHLLAGLE